MKLAIVLGVIYALGVLTSYGYDLRMVTIERAADHRTNAPLLPVPEIGAGLRALLWPISKPLALSAYVWEEINP
jgi:hypothetical protein